MLNADCYKQQHRQSRDKKTVEPESIPPPQIVEQLQVELFQEVNPTQFLEFDYLNKFFDSLQRIPTFEVKQTSALTLPDSTAPMWSFGDTFGKESRSCVWQ
eukprot:TRINITY_DN2715_c0_g1_i2.p1 TRINITY_DN2715_c0_g1~~TRINITY_DN2715_c0_g1_i2.p1  ORF type:complete len:101 (-),score=14.44 TRINITY_DN2715_c0_g1_i2:310-612(-)